MANMQSTNLTISTWMVAAVVAMVVMTLWSCSAVRSEAEAADGWKELIGDQGLDAWMRAPMHAHVDFPDQWIEVGRVWAPQSQAGKLMSAPGKGVIVNGAGGRSWNLVTKQPYADVEAHIEFMVPKGSNSGIYFMGRYEVQVLDSYGRTRLVHGDCGGIYQRWDPSRGKGKEGFEGHPPRVNATRPPGEWQSFDVIFRAPRFDAAGHKTANARFVKVLLNGKVVQENVEVTGPTRSACFNDEKPTGPIMIQGDHGPVAYRHFRLRPLR